MFCLEQIVHSEYSKQDINPLYDDFQLHVNSHHSLINHNTSAFVRVALPRKNYSPIRREICHESTKSPPAVDLRDSCISVQGRNASSVNLIRVCVCVLQPTAAFYWRTLRSSTSRSSTATRASARYPATIVPRSDIYYLVYTFAPTPIEPPWNFELQYGNSNGKIIPLPARGLISDQLFVHDERFEKFFGPKFYITLEYEILRGKNAFSNLAGLFQAVSTRKVNYQMLLCN